VQRDRVPPGAAGAIESAVSALSKTSPLITGALFIGAALMLAPWPWALFVVMPVNRVPEATPVDAANAETRTLIEKCGTLRAGRTALGIAATLVYLWAIL